MYWNMTEGSEDSILITSRRLILFLCLICLSFTAYPQQASLHSVCEKWFKAADIKKGPNCIVECSMEKIDMETFQCHDLCAELCSPKSQKVKKKQKSWAKPHMSILQNALFWLFAFYPGNITDEDRVLIAKHPFEMYAAHQVRNRSYQLCKPMFGKPATNDASDACRHFVGSALLYKELGPELSEKILNAHEESVDQPFEQKRMDLANNSMGLLAAEELRKQGKLNQSEVMESLKEHYKKDRLVILQKEPSPNKEKGYY